MPIQITLTVQPTIRGISSIPPFDMKMVAQWYREQLDDILLEVANVKKVDVSDTKNHILIKCILLSTTSESDCAFFADPDEDGNHPLLYQGKERLVYGKLLLTEETTIEDDIHENVLFTLIIQPLFIIKPFKKIDGKRYGKRYHVPMTEMENVLAWYKKRLDQDLLKRLGIKKMEISNNENNIVIKISSLPNDCLLLINPDQEGKHPVMWNGTECLVEGAVMVEQPYQPSTLSACKTGDYDYLLDHCTEGTTAEHLYEAVKNNHMIIVNYLLSVAKQTCTSYEHALLISMICEQGNCEMLHLFAKKKKLTPMDVLVGLEKAIQHDKPIIVDYIINTEYVRADKIVMEYIVDNIYKTKPKPCHAFAMLQLRYKETNKVNDKVKFSNFLTIVGKHTFTRRDGKSVIVHQHGKTFTQEFEKYYETNASVLCCTGKNKYMFMSNDNVYTFCTSSEIQTFSGGKYVGGECCYSVVQMDVKKKHNISMEKTLEDPKQKIFNNVVRVNQ